MSSETKQMLGTAWPQLPWAILAVTTLLLAAIYYDGLLKLVEIWNTQEEYSHGFLIPIISAYILWQRKQQLQRLPWQGMWLGPLIVFIATLMYVVGEFSVSYALIHYSILIMLLGLVLSFYGRPGLVVFGIPILFLIFMIPMPRFLYGALSNQLQLVSSELGVAAIRLMGIDVFLEGNVIDLGVYKLQVVEACNGLRYLFPLMSFSFICAYFFNAKLWMRLVVFLSAIPIAVFMNGFRIGVTGALVEYQGTSVAEGFLHDFEGWIVFMASIGVLIGVMWLLCKVTGMGTLGQLFVVDFGREASTHPSIQQQHGEPKKNTIPSAFWYSLLVLFVIVSFFSFISKRAPEIPQRTEFTQFDMEMGQWRGKRNSLERNIVNRLGFSDYLYADFQNDVHDWIELYIGFWNVQKENAMPHSPRACIPGGGWRVLEIAPYRVKDVKVGGETLIVNRIRIAKGEQKQLVYYWYQQRGRVVRGEYAMKWYLFWDALVRQRLDGGQIRLITAIPSGDRWADGDRRLADFIGRLELNLDAYVPN